LKKFAKSELIAYIWSKLKIIIMKKFYSVLFFNLLFVFSSMAQLNPIRNMVWTHTYEMPNNCFSLNWTEPVLSSNDTLIGYNIYRDQILYTFTTETYHDCNPCIGIPNQPFCSFMNYNMGEFYMHVTAVYNYNHVESIYTDSVNFGGIAIKIKEVSNNDKLKILAVTQKNTTLRIELNQSNENGELMITNLLGQTFNAIPLNNQKNIEINISNYISGIYFLNLKTNKDYLTRKVIIK
jgi:hypothetical protein